MTTGGPIEGAPEGIFKAMKGLPVTIRLLDPPLHEFLPHTDEDLTALAEQGEFDPLIGRDTELERIIQTLVLLAVYRAILRRERRHAAAHE